jgi:hypothetical protein
MVGFLKSILRNMKRLNCFPRPTQHSEHSEQSVSVLDRRKDILITKESGSSTQRQASGTDTFNDSLEAIENPVIVLPGTYKVVADITCRLARHAVQPLLTTLELFVV